MQARLQLTLTGRKSSSVVPVASLWASLSSKLRDSNRSSSAADMLSQFVNSLSLSMSGACDSGCSGETRLVLHVPSSL